MRLTVVLILSGLSAYGAIVSLSTTCTAGPVAVSGTTGCLAESPDGKYAHATLEDVVTYTQEWGWPTMTMSSSFRIGYPGDYAYVGPQDASVAILGRRTMRFLSEGGGTATERDLHYYYVNDRSQSPFTGVLRIRQGRLNVTLTESDLGFVTVLAGVPFLIEVEIQAEIRSVLWSGANQFLGVHAAFSMMGYDYQADPQRKDYPITELTDGDDGRVPEPATGLGTLVALGLLMQVAYVRRRDVSRGRPTCRTIAHTVTRPPQI